MITKRDVQLGKIALRVGMVSKEQLAKSIAIQKKLDKKVGLGAIWLKKGFVTKDQLEEIVKLHNAEKDKNGASGKKKKGKKKKAPGQKSESTASESTASESTASESTASEAPASESELGSVGGGSDEASKKEEASKKDEASKKEEASSAEAPAEKKTSKTSAALKKDDKKDEASSEEAKAEKKTSKTSAALKKDDKKDEASSEEAKAEKKSSKTQPALDEKKGKTGKIEKKPRDTSNDSEVDAALFESVMADESQEEDASRRVIACSECKKKYRVKKKQVGKRFSCRNCGEKVRVPADLFDRPAQTDKGDKTGKGAKGAKGKKGEPEVEEFTLSGHEDESGSDEGSAPAKPAKPASGKAPPAKEAGKSGPQKKEPGKSGANPAVAAAAAAPKDPTSIAELAKLAEKRQAAPLGPKISGKKLVGLYIQAALLILLALGIGGGIWYWNYAKEQELIAKHRAEVDRERDLFRAPYDAGIKAARDALEKAKAAEPSVELLQDLTTATSLLEAGRSSVKVLLPSDKPIDTAPTVTIQQPENTTFAIKYDQDQKGQDLVRDLILAHGTVQLRLGGQKFLSDAVRDFQSVLDLDKKNPDPSALALLGRAELLRRNYKVAIDNLKKSQAAQTSPRTRAWLALAFESGDVQREAVPAYEALAQSEPLAKVFKARALLHDGDVDTALAEATDATGKLGNDGEPLAAAHAIRGLILERKGDADASDKAFDACVTAGGESSRAYCARGEHRLRTGKFADAAKDFENAIKISGGARAALGLGDAKAGLLDADGARTARNQATDLPLKRSAALLAGDIDAFDDPHAPDPRSLAFRRMGDAAFATGRLDEARAHYMNAIQKDAFDPEAFAALARVEVEQKDETSAEGHAKQARTLLFSANDRPSPGEDPPLVRGSMTARVLLIEAIVWKARGNLGAAEKSINGALQADALAAGAYAYSLKGRIFVERGDNTAAKTEYLKALDVEETAKDLGTKFYLQAKSELAGAAKSGDAAALAKTRSAIEAALALAPNHAHALFLRGRVAIVEKRWGDALNDLSAAIKLNPYFREAYASRGFLYIRDLPDERRDDQATAKATTDFGFVLSIDQAAGETKADVFFGRALCEWAAGDTKGALEDLKKAIELLPKWWEPYATRAEINRKNGRDADAAADKKKAEELKKSGEQP